MQSEQQQRIMGYFIEEAKDHLNTIEQGLLNLQSTIQDSEMVSEVFRAAHSVKGGAAMLGLGSIQQTSHRLEDYFKVLKECPVKVDQKLESLFLRVFDTLQELVEQLQGPFGLTDDKAQEAMAEVEPVFNSLNEHLGLLVSQAGGTPPEDVQLGGTPTVIPVPVAATPVSRRVVQEESALQLIFQSDVPARLREMLQFFKQPDSNSSRQQLQQVCQSLTQAGEQFDLPKWAELVKLAERAIANPDNSYRTLAPILIKDIKQAQELVLAQRAGEICPSDSLQALAPVAILDEPIDDFANLLAEINFEDDSTPEFIEFDLESEEPFSSIISDSDVVSESLDDDWFTNGTSLQEETLQEETVTDFDFDLESVNPNPTNITTDDLGFGDELDETTVTPPVGDRNGPEVGLAELNSLADLFEGEVPDLGMTWQQEEVIADDVTGLFEEPTPADDFADLLDDPDELEELELDPNGNEEDLSDLLNTSSTSYANSVSSRSTPAYDLSELPELLADLPPTSPSIVEDDLEELTFENSFEDSDSEALFDSESLFSDPESASISSLDDATSSEMSGLEDFGEMFLNLEDEEATHIASLTPEATDGGAISSTSLGTSPFDVLADPFDDVSQPTQSSTLNDPFALNTSDIDLGSHNSLNEIPEENDPFTLGDIDLDLGDEGSFEVLEDLSADGDLIESLIQEDAANLEQFGDAAEPSATESAFDAWAALDAEEEIELPPAVDPVVPQEHDVSADLWEDTPTPTITTPPIERFELPSDAAFSELFTEEIDNLQPEAAQSELESLDFNVDAGPDLSSSFWAEDADTDTTFEELSIEGTSEVSLEALLFDDEQSLDPTAPEIDVEASELFAFADLDLSLQPDTNPEAVVVAQDLLVTETELAELLIDDSTNETDLASLLGEESTELDDPFAFDLSLDLTESSTEETSEADFSQLFDEDTSTFDPSLLDEIIEPTATEDAIVDLENLELADLDALEIGELPSDAADTDIADSDFSLGLNASLTSDPEPTFDFNELEPDASASETSAFDLNFDLPEADIPSGEDAPASETSAFDLNFDLPEADIPPSEESDLGLDLSSMIDSLSTGATDSDTTTREAIADLDAAFDEAIFSFDELSPELDLSTTDSADEAIFSVDEQSSEPTLSDRAIFSFDEQSPEPDLSVIDSGDEAIFSFDEQPSESVSSAESSLDSLDLGELTLDVDEALGGSTQDDDFAAILGKAAEPGSESTSSPGFDDLADLDALLDGESTDTDADILETATTDSIDFGDLDALLDDSLNTLSESDNLFEFDSGSLTSAELTDTDDFTDLDALLAGDIASEPTTGIPDSDSQEDDEFANLDLLLSETPTSPPIVEPISPSRSSSSGSDFDDLEKLLENADQTLGGSPTTRGARGPSLVPSRNKVRPTRGVLSDQTMRVSVKNLDNLNNLVGELVVNRNSLEQAEERLRQFLDNLLYQVQQLGDVGQRMRDLYERSLLESSLLSSRKSYQMSSPGNGGASQSSHATGASFDALEMDRFTGFHTLSQEMIELIVRVRESASDIDFVVDETDQVTRNFRQITTQLQEGLTRSRMVPFAQTADRLPRAVRDISLKCGKQAELVVEGRETLIDKMILEQLYDPMTHLVNNAITHGIETPEERAASSKNPMGRITVRTFHQGNQTVISVSDDGAGINPETVKRKAIEKGLISAAEARDMSRLDVYDLLFHHGFSTKDKADDFAGRGVGMDVVRTSLNEIRGVINIDSTVGRGTTFTIRLPLTLSISKALCCISNRARIAFPMDGVEDMLDVPKERIQRDSQDRPCIQWRDQLLPFQPLSELLKYNRNLGRGSVYGGNQEEDIVSVVVLRSNAGNFLALQVDQVLGEQEIVIKQLEGPVPKPVGVAGATVLGDGRIMPIADVLELIDLSLGRIRREAGSSLWEKDADQVPPEVLETKTEPTVLIVDDSITVRELLSMTFNKIGYRVEQARDGQEAWEKLRSGLPCDLVFCDIEMPRMDGLELLSRIQKDPSLTHLPIAMLTSRGADRHRQMAIQLGAKGYFTKPYLEEALLDAAQRMLKGEVLVNAGS